MAGVYPTVTREERVRGTERAATLCKATVSGTKKLIFTSFADKLTDSTVRFWCLARCPSVRMDSSGFNSIFSPKSSHKYFFSFSTKILCFVRKSVLHELIRNLVRPMLKSWFFKVFAFDLDEKTGTEANS